MPDASVPGVSDEELTRAIGEGAGPVLDIHRRPWEYSTSAPLELVTARLRNSPPRQFVLKHLSPRTMTDHARLIKPAFVVVPHREIEVYRRLLGPAGVGPKLVASMASRETGTYWLLTEKVSGREMYQVGDVPVWCAVAEWLARMHDCFARVDVEAVTREAALIEYDRRWYSTWMERALDFFADRNPRESRRDRSALRWLADRYPQVIDRLMTLPATIIHGEFYSSNVLVLDGDDERRVCPVDWEMAAAGPGVIDLAALTLGRWSDGDRRAVISAYASTVRGSGTSTIADAIDAVMLAQIHLSVQWLGWFGHRQPPAEHRLDWLSDAIERAEMLRL